MNKKNGNDEKSVLPPSVVPEIKTRNIPWLNIVQFHKEIVARAEDQFFALEGGSPNHKRWTSLEGFNSHDSAGPWEIGLNELKSDAFRINLDQGAHESCFIGAACYRSDIKLQGQYKPRWVPLLYREVEVREEEGLLKVNPLAGSWSLSPLFLGLLERLEIQPEEDLVQQLLGQVHGDQRSFSEQIFSALFQLYPDVKRDLTDAIPDGWSDKPALWVLFAPTTVFGAFIRHLMADYVSLENALIQNVNNIGGLGVLDVSRPAVSRGDIDLLPIVPLNSSQHQAAEAVFQGRSVTVISGPPGTGKSQVAVSVLLNAWAQGKKCLFVSNNNKAVNVVNERLRALQGGVPVVVRAGSSQENTIVPDLTRILTLQAGEGGTAKPDGLKKQISPLEEEYDGLIKFLEARRGKEIDDLRMATFEAYQEYNCSVENTHKKEEAFDDELVSFGGTRGMGRLIAEEAFKKTQVWVDQFSTALHLRKQEDLRREKIKQEISECEEHRKDALEKLDLVIEPSGNGRWLVDGTQPSWLFAWKQKLEVILNSNVNRVLAEISNPVYFSEIQSSGEAQNTKSAIQSLANEIDEWCVGLQNRLNEVEDFNTAYETSRTQLESYGVILDNVRCSLAQLDDWLESYNEYRSFSSCWLDFIPFSRHRRLEKKLRVLDRKFRMSFPTQLFGDAANVDHEGMYPTIKAAGDWKSLKVRAQEMERKGVVDKTTHRKLKIWAGQFNFASQHIPQTLLATEWENFVAQCHEWVMQLLEEEQQWKRIEEKQAFENECRGLAGEWQQTVVSVPLLNRWTAERGERFHSLMVTIAFQPTKEGLQDARLGFFSPEFSELAENWNQAVLQQKQLEKLLKRRAEIPTAKSRLQNWLDQKSPEGFSLLGLNAGEWPKKPTLDLWLNNIGRWIDRERIFREVDFPNLKSVSQGRYKEAVGKLGEALNSLPDSSQKTELSSIVEKLVEPSEWPVETIREFLKDFGSDRIHATLSRLETQLQDLSLKYAQSLWLHRLRNDGEACQSVAQLRDVFQNRLKIGSGDFLIFRKTLSLAPIWITTAQSSQSIPMEVELFDVVMIDEATQCTLTNLLPLIYRGKTLVVLGDQNQLSPIFGVGKYDQEIVARRHGVESYLSSLGHYGKNVYSTAVNVLPFREGDVVSLNQHYRSDPLVIGFSNREIYNQSLQLRKDPEWSGELPIASGMYKVHVNGIANRGSNGKSWKNQHEADAVLAKVLELRNHPSLAHKSIGIVTPFRAQKDLIVELLATNGQSEVLAGTADTFQGDERDIMIFSPVVSRGMERNRGTIKWIEDPHNRINVALTRARDANFIVGDFEVCRNLPGILGKLIKYCEIIESLRETSPAELYLFSWMMIKGWTPIVQHPVANMRVDFYLKANNGDRFAVEVDGKVGRNGEWIHLPHTDDMRDVALRNNGFEPLHFPAKDVIQTPLTVIKKIEEALGSA